ncbi:MAG: C1 family peptidase [Cytophagales bacterium]|nr:C1 family peptidase [Cytophagales bacterium]
MASKELDEFSSYPSTFLEADGTSLKAALDVARKFGVVRDDDLPFGSGKLASDEPEVFFAKASEFKIKSYFNLSRNPNEWRKWLATQGPILTRLDVDDAWMKLGSSGKLLKYDAASAQGGHAVAIVGYQADGSFIVRNSWNTTWGAKGFAFASKEYAQAAFTETFGVIV